MTTVHRRRRSSTECGCEVKQTRSEDIKYMRASSRVSRLDAAAIDQAGTRQGARCPVGLSGRGSGISRATSGRDPCMHAAPLQPHQRFYFCFVRKTRRKRHNNQNAQVIRESEEEDCQEATRRYWSAARGFSRLEEAAQSPGQRRETGEACFGAAETRTTPGSVFYSCALHLLLFPVTHNGQVDRVKHFREIVRKSGIDALSLEDLRRGIYA